METTPVLIPVEKIDPNPYQPRQKEDPAAVAELAENIKRNTLLQVPTARQVNGRYQLAFGHTRLAAFKANGEKTMPLIIRDLDDLQMFEMGVSENIKRRDLNPIEEAESMRRYMTDFGKTSVEAGEFFGVSEETVRGKVRLLNLPDEAKRAMAAGEISIPAARTLLTLAKIAPAKTVVETVERIIKQKDSRLPDDVIENTFRNKLEDAVTMHTGDGKPKSSHRGGWDLDMKKFPVQMLPFLTPVDIAVALGIQDDGRLLGMLEVAHQNLEAGSWETALKQAFADEDPALLQKIDHLLRPPACTACPFYARVHGSHFCGMKICHARKTAAWRAHTIEKASKNLSIPVYQTSDGAYKMLDYGDESLFNKRHKDLRLVSVDQVKGYIFQSSYKGVDDDIFGVVATGTALEKIRSSRTTQFGKKTTAELVKMRQMKVYRPRRRELIWEFALGMKHLFDGLTYPMLKDLDRKMGYLQQDLEPSKEVMVAENAKVDAEKADYYRCKIIWRLAVENAWGEINNVTKFDEILKRLERLAKEWGVKMPKKLATMAGHFQTELDAIAEATKAQKAEEKKGRK